MKAHVFARLNQDRVVITGYHQLRLGAYLRREKTKRKYIGYFVFQKRIWGDVWDRLKIKQVIRQGCIEEPALVKNASVKNAYYFRIPGWEDFFEGLRDHRALVKDLLWKLLQPDIKNKVTAVPAPCIGVHIRMGDFKKLASHQDFKSVGQTRTPELYFTEAISLIRSIHGSVLPVTIFTDGYRHEFEYLHEMENVHFCEGNPDIVDMLLLSRSHIIVTSAGSTFSYWSGFLSDAPVILHPDHIHAPIRSEKENELYEGPLDAGNERVLAAIRRIPRMFSTGQTVA